MTILDKTTAIVVATCVLASGCVSRQPLPTPTYAIDAPFDAADAARLLADGSNTIKGNAFLRQRGGGVVTCAGQSVVLVPATKYAIERFRMLYGTVDSGVSDDRRDHAFVPDSSEYRHMIKTTKCDAQGNFTFERVADGEFFISVLVTWSVGYSPQGGSLMQRVHTGGGKTTAIVMAH